MENNSSYKDKPVRIAERYKFFKRDQLQEETTTIYLSELKKLARTCEFRAYADEALCDRFVCGIKNKTIQADLLTKHYLTLDDALKLAQNADNENDPFLESHKEEDELKLSNCEDFENFCYSLDIKEELQPLERQEEFEVQQEFVDLQCEPNLLFETDELQLSDHDSKKKFVCEFCQNAFLCKAHLKRHQRSHTGEKPFFCRTCKKCFSRREGLRHTQRSFECVDYEEQKGTFEAKFRDTKRKVEHICAVCGRPFIKKSHLLRHFRIHTGEKPYTCAICKNSFTRKESLKQHLRIHDREGNNLQDSVKTFAIKKTLKCKICGNIFLSKTDLEQHSGSHTENGSSNEDIKMLELSDKAEKLETRIALEKKIKKPFLCHICDYRTSKNFGLEIHLKRHAGEKSFACDICNFKAVCKNDLNIHKRIHSGEKLLICEFCGYKTNYSSLLQTHIRSHTGEKPFMCKFCDYKCAERNSLKNHIRIHTGEKPFSCSFCDFRAAQRTGLVYHLKIHKKEELLVAD